MTVLHGLPTIGRNVQELDGSFYGVSLHELAMRHMQWNPHGQHLPTAQGESLAFYSPWDKHQHVRGEFRVFYYDKYPKKCIPTWSEFEVEVRETASTTMLIKTKTWRERKGATIRLYRKESDCVYPMWGHPTPAVLNGELIARLDEWREARQEPALEPHPAFPALQGARDGMVYICHMGLACAVKWQSHTMGDLLDLSRLTEPLEKRFLATVQYDQKVHMPPNAA